MAKFIEIFDNLVFQSINQVYEFIVKHGPGIVFAFAVIVLGWISAVIVKKIAVKLLRALGFDVLSEKIGFKKFLEKGGVEKRPSVLTGSVFYWIILLNALIMAQDAVDLNITSQFLQQVILYIPNIIVIIILIALSIFVSGFISRFIDKTARFANIPFHAFLGTISRYAVIGFAIIIALEYLNVPAKIISDSLFIIFGIIPVVVFLVFMIAGRDIVSNVLNGRFLMKEFEVGDRIEFDLISGRVEEIGLTSTKLKKDDREIVIPNSELAKKIVTKKSDV
ncbi:MAG: mechanosensitive ion channel [Candidatus Omnitrophica bacterium]|nr:mechanosensitive ion channel [Candidatus Omnitrophota bacterium]